MGNIIVTGAAGFIGSNLVKHLLHFTSHNILALDNLSLGKKENLNLENSRVIFREIDIASERDLKEKLLEFEDADIHSLWHMAANSDIPAGVEDSALDFRNTFLTTYRITEFLKNKNIKEIHFASSSAVYGNHGIKKISEDTGPLLPISNYGSFKLSSEAFLSSIVEESDAKLFIYRFPNVVGTPATHGVIYDFISRLKKDPEILYVKGNGTQRKQYLFVEDLIKGMIIASKELKDQRNIINIGPNDDGITVKEIAELTVKEYGMKSRIIFGESTRGWKGDIPKFKYDISKLESIGWIPIYNSSSEAILKAIKEIINQICK